MNQDTVYSEFQNEFELFCCNKSLKFSKITDYVYKFPENSFNQYQGEFYLDFSKVNLQLKVKLKGLQYTNLQIKLIEEFKSTPKYNEIGLFIYELKSTLIFDLFQEIYETLELLSTDLDTLELSTPISTLYSLALHPNSSSTLLINKQRYKDIYEIDPLIWFGDYFLVISNNLATNQLFINCFIELKTKGLLKNLGRKTQFNPNVDLVDVLQYFGIKLHGKFMVKYLLYKSLFDKKSSWMDFYLEKSNEDTWIVSCPEIPSFILNENQNSVEFLEECRGNLQFKKPSISSFKIC